jgi:hypothetical protein
MILRLWKWYMADVHAWEQHARATNNAQLLALVELFKSNRITALCMAGFTLVVLTSMLFRFWR